MTLRLELRIKNGQLWRLIHEHANSVAEFCRLSGIKRQEHVGALLSFKLWPLLETGEYCSTCQRISEFIGVACRDLFPLDEYARVGAKGEFHAREVAASQLPGAEEELAQLVAPAPDPDQDRGEDKAQINKALATLTFREREILKLRYGLGDGHTYTLEEVGRIFKVTRERVRWIQAKALRKLEHPTRLRYLLPLAADRGLVDDAD